MVLCRNIIASYGASAGREFPALNLASADAPYEAIVPQSGHFDRLTKEQNL